MNIPRGIWFESNKNRWRVRLYKSGMIIFRSYHKTFEEALEAYNEAKSIQRTIDSPRFDNLDISTDTTANLIQSLTAASAKSCHQQKMIT